MTAPNNKIDLYDDAKVDARVKRLAFCFNLAAGSPASKGFGADNLLKTGLDLFKATTADTQAFALNADEKAYMRLQFVKIAAKLQGDRSTGWASYEETIIGKADDLMATALKLKLIK